MTIPAVTAPVASPSSGNALASLTSNLNNFLGLLMVQLKNQDPSSPMDTNQFTSQLVQFASVEQQVNINNGVQSLIQLTQANGVLQSSSLVGKTISATSTRISLQNGTGSIQFPAQAVEPVTISVIGGNGSTIQQVSLTTSAGQNNWTWNGSDSSGRQMPDGAYKVAVSGSTAGTPATAIPFTVTGIASGVVTQNNIQQVRLGQVTLPVSAIKSVSN